MNQYDDLRSDLKNTPLLHVDGDGVARLIARADVANVVASADSASILMDLERALAAYVRLVGVDDRTYVRDELTVIVGAAPATIQAYAADGVLPASVTPADGPGRGRAAVWSWRDGFIAGCVGALRRQRMPIDTLRRVAELLRHPATVVESVEPECEHA